MGPMARANPAPSRITALPASEPSSTGPSMGVRVRPEASTLPPSAWPDSMRPIAATRFHSIPHDGASRAIRSAAAL